MSIPFSRRQFLRGAVASAGARHAFRPTLGAAIISSIPGRSEAEPATMIAIASAVVGAISAMNATDGGTSALLQASYQRLGLILESLETIQFQIADLLIEIRRLDEVMAAQLAAERQLEFHEALRTDIEAFRQLYSKWDQQLPQKDWLESSNVAPELQDIRNRISHNTARARAADRYDAVTGIIESIYAFLDLSVAALVGYSSYERARTARIHLDWIDRIVDFQQPGSAAASLAENTESHNILMDQIWEGPVLKNYDSSRGDGIHSCVGINYSSPRGGGPRQRRPPDLSTRMYVRYSLKEVEAAEGRLRLGYKIYDFDVDDQPTVEASPSPCDWSIAALHMPRLEQQLAHLRTMGRFSAGNQELLDLKTDIANINLLRAQMALSTNAITAVLRTKRTLETESQGGEAEVVSTL